MTRLLFRIFSILFALPCALLAVGALLEGVLSGGQGGTDHVLLATHATMLALLATAFAGSVWRSADRIAWWQTALVVVGCLLATGIRFRVSDPAFEVGFPLAIALTGLLHPARGQLFRPTGRVDGLLAVVALVAAAPVAVLAAHLGGVASDLTGERQLDVIAGYHAIISLPFLGLLAALRTPGWRLPAIGAGVVATVYGVASLMWPDDTGSAGVVGLVAVALGAGFTALAFRTAGRGRVDEPVVAVADPLR